MILADAFSSSEALGMGISVSGGGSAAKTASFTLGPDVRVLTEDGRQVEPGSDEVGVLALGGRNPLGYYKDEEKSGRTFKEIDGVRYSIPGDYAQVDADGTIHLLGRGSVCINSGGEKIFPEEVEEALKTHDAVRDAVVVGIPHPTYGEQIVAVVELHDGGRRAGGGRADRARQGAPGLVQGAPARPHRRHNRAGAQRQGRLQAPPRRVDGRARGRRRLKLGVSSPVRVPVCVRRVDPGQTESHVHRPGRRHPRRGRMALLRRAPSVRPPGRAGWSRRATCPWSCPRSSCLEGDTVWLHLVRANPVFGALAENPRVLLSVADDWAFIPSSWKVVGDEDPALGIPTTYYGAVQLTGTATVHDERTAPGSVAAILRRQLSAFQPEVAVADPGESHPAKLLGILGIAISVEQVSAKFKYGGNVDEAHRRAVVARLRERGWPGDDAAAAHVVRRLAGSRASSAAAVGSPTRRRRPGWPASPPSPAPRAPRCGRP